MNENKTILHIAIESNQIAIVKFLFAANPKLIQAKDKDGNNALHCASINGNIDALNALLYHIPPEISRELHYKSKSEALFYKLSKSALSQNSQSEWNGGNSSLILEKNQDGMNVLHCAVKSGNVATIDLIISHNFRHAEFMNEKDNNGNTLLHLAAKNQDPSAFKYLIKFMDYSAKFLEEIDNQGNLSFYYLSKEVQINVITAIKLKILTGKLSQKDLSQYADLFRKIQSDNQDQEINNLVRDIINTDIAPNLSRQQEDVRDISSSSSSSSSSTCQCGSGQRGGAPPRLGPNLWKLRHRRASKSCKAKSDRLYFIDLRCVPNKVSST